MRMQISFLITYFFVIQSVLCSARLPDFKNISDLMIKNGCDEEHVLSDRVRLSGKNKEAKDLIVYCETDCGARQCTYSIYLSENERYHYAGAIFGSYEILKKQHAGFFDLKTITKSPAGETLTKILQLKGSSYQ